MAQPGTAPHTQKRLLVRPLGRKEGLIGPCRPSAQELCSERFRRPFSVSQPERRQLRCEAPVTPRDPRDRDRVHQHCREALLLDLR